MAKVVAEHKRLFDPDTSNERNEMPLSSIRSIDVAPERKTPITIKDIKPGQVFVTRSADGEWALNRPYIAVEIDGVALKMGYVLIAMDADGVFPEILRATDLSADEECRTVSLSMTVHP